MTKKIWMAIVSGAVLGIFCILGGAVRLGWQGNQLLLFSLWYNRVLMGLLIGFVGLGAASVGLMGYFIPSIRNAEDILPDHDELAKVEQPESEDTQGEKSVEGANPE